MLRTLLVLTALFVGATAFGQDIVGKWKLDLDSLASDPELAKMTPEKRAEALKMGQQMLRQMTLEATKDGKAEMALRPGMSQSGTWAKDATGSFIVTIDGSGKKATVVGDTLSVAEGGATLQFKRASAGAPGKPVAEAPPIDFGGAWTLAVAATIAAAADDKKSQMKKMSEAMTGMRMTFGKGTFSMAGKDMSRSGTFTVKGTIAGVTVLASREAKSGRTEDMSLTRVGDHLHIAIDGDTMVFAR
ncbi:MAG: hypothetical protein ACI9U2_002061 [Bradymonadia bacterium]|jgi:hypothetical protein